jgi:hypothetical protein
MIEKFPAPTSAKTSLTEAKFSVPTASKNVSPGSRAGQTGDCCLVW